MELNNRVYSFIGYCFPTIEHLICDGNVGVLLFTTYSQTSSTKSFFFIYTQGLFPLILICLCFSFCLQLQFKLVFQVPVGDFFWCPSGLINSPESCCLLDSTKTFVSLSLLLSLSFVGFHRESYTTLESTVLSYFSDIRWGADCPCFRSARFRPARVNFSHCLEESIEFSVLIPQESVFGGVLRGLKGMKTEREME